MSSKTDRILAFICQFKQEHAGIPPTIRDIRDGCAISSTSNVIYHLDRLERDGYIRRLPDIDARNIILAGEQWLAPDELAPAEELFA